MQKPKRACLLAPILVFGTVFSGCYTVKQGYHQARLLYEAKPISRVLEQKQESETRLQKLQWVPRVLSFAHEDLGLKNTGSYQKYVALESPVLTYLVQAAPKRKFELKTWWFPVVGRQPYLGFFKKEEAIALQKELQEEGFDTVLSGAQAFSMLGFWADPVYSTMLDGNSLVELVEVLIHELAHSTLYVPGFSSFNENFANFVGVQGAKLFLDKNVALGVNGSDYVENEKKSEAVRQKFQEYLGRVRQRLEAFYMRAAQNPSMLDDTVFLAARDREFDGISGDYKAVMGGLEKGSRYEHAFARERLNNARVLSYALYDAHQGVFEKLWKVSRENMKQFLSLVQRCVNKTPDSEAQLWSQLESCEENAQ